MFKLISFICVFYAVMVQTNHVEACKSCGKIAEMLNTTMVTFLNTYHYKKITYEPHSNDRPSSTVKPTENRKPDDVTVTLCTELFQKKYGLKHLTVSEKQSAIQLLIVKNSSLTVQLQPVVLFNLVDTFVNSPGVLAALTEKHLTALLTTMTVNPCAMRGLPKTHLVRFFRCLMTLPVHLLSRVPKSVFVALTAVVPAAGAFDGWSFEEARPLITVLAMSRASFNCLPTPFLVSMLEFLAPNQALLATRLPTSTMFGFYRGLLDSLHEPPHSYLTNALPAPALASVFGAALNGRTLGVMPADLFDSMLAVVGSSRRLLEALPPTHIVSVFSTLTTSPLILAALSPVHLAGLLTAVSTSESASNAVPMVLWNDLMVAVIQHSPATFNVMNNGAEYN